MSDTHLKTVAMSQWGIGDEAIIGYSGEQVTIIGFDPNDSDWVLVNNANGGTFITNLQPVPSEGVAIPPKGEAETPDEKPFEQLSLAAMAAKLEADDAAGTAEPTIATREMHLAGERDDLTKLLNDARDKIDALTEQAAKDRRAVGEKHDNLTSALLLNEHQSNMLQEAAVTIGQQQTEIERLSQAAVQSSLEVKRAKRDIKLVNAPIRNAAELTDLRVLLEDLDTQEWEIAYETYSDFEYFARLIRTAQTPAYVPPLKASAEEPAPAPAPTPEEAPQPEALPDLDDDIAIQGSQWEGEEDAEIDIVTIDPDQADDQPAPENEPELEPEPMGQGTGATLSPVANYLLNQSARSPRQTGASLLTRKPDNMQRRGKPGPQYADDAIPHEVLDDGNLLLGGRVVIDPTKMPVIGTILQHGAKALLNGWDFQTEEKVQAAMAEARAKQLTFTMPRTLGLPASVNS